MKRIDLRSDTVTQPSKEMLQYMMEAELGDDVYGEDPTVNTLQNKIAELFGKEDALFVPSGTMSNQISLKIITDVGDEVITDEDAHIFYYETGAPSIISGLQVKTIQAKNGMMDLNKIEYAIRPDVYYFPKTKVISLENTHNRHGGSILDIEYIKNVRGLADKHNLKIHLDGARIWNASIATNISLKSYGQYFDTISVCLSKGLGAPVGSLVVSDRENIAKAKKWRKILGGGMRQAGILAAAGIFAINNNLEKLNNDHILAKQFANELQNINKIHCDLNKIHTNIVIFEIDQSINITQFLVNCKNNGLLISTIGSQTIRAVFHLDISKEEMLKSIDIIENVIKGI